MSKGLYSGLTTLLSPLLYFKFFGIFTLLIGSSHRGELSYPLSHGCKIETNPELFGSLNLMNHLCYFKTPLIIFLNSAFSFFILFLSKINFIIIAKIGGWVIPDE